MQQQQHREVVASAVVAVTVVVAVSAVVSVHVHAQQHDIAAVAAAAGTPYV
jgi:hypothetical protein